MAVIQILVNFSDYGRDDVARVNELAVQIQEIFPDDDIHVDPLKVDLKELRKKQEQPERDPAWAPYSDFAFSSLFTWSFQQLPPLIISVPWEAVAGAAVGILMETARDWAVEHARKKDKKGRKRNEESSVRVVQESEHRALILDQDGEILIIVQSGQKPGK
jgi:hypothetical protein